MSKNQGLQEAKNAIVDPADVEALTVQGDLPSMTEGGTDFNNKSQQLFVQLPNTMVQAEDEIGVVSKIYHNPKT
ncbi:hypothetical protein PGT21_021868 [Puccinia graminis f. sp. tritici]|uniref:Uncharacterized protein n=1 Tax=Puccinia graminis f. sp. tritici TaxID=56615 RepID=A0A5B0QNP2_PUCGR|nr:hypothetical protein PGT21_021868 [Puccinia graminis f. sp. tritici]